MSLDFENYVMNEIVYIEFMKKSFIETHTINSTLRYTSGYTGEYIGNRLIAKICLSSAMSIIPIECQWLYKHTLLIPHELVAYV